MSPSVPQNRKRQLLAADDVEVRVVDRLIGVRVGVDDHPEAALGDSGFLCDMLRQLQHLGEDLGRGLEEREITLLGPPSG